MKKPLWSIAVAAQLLWLFGCSDNNGGTDKDASVQVDGADAAVADAAVDGPAADQQAPKVRGEVIILHTNDMHAHLMGTGPVLEYTPAAGDDSTIGGFARLSALVEGQRTDAGDTPVLLLDAGDFTMGTAFSNLLLSHAPEMAEMQAMGYDAIALGNHEFDWGPAALAAMIDKAKSGGFDVPLLATNVVFDPSSSEDDGLESLEKGGVIDRTLVKTLDNGLKVGIFSLLGEVAASDAAPTAGPVTWKPLAEVAKSTVEQLRNVDKVDLVIALSHSGLTEEGEGEDADLAAEVAGIDVIVSGHTHTVLPEPVRVGDTWIVQTGDFARHLGRLRLQVFDDGSIDVPEYALLEVDDAIQGDAAVQERIEGYISEVDELFAPQAYRKVVAELGFDMVRGRENLFVELPLGNMVTDAYVAAVTALEPDAPAEVAIESPSSIRDPLLKGAEGQLAFADLYRVLSTGSGPDGKAGWPLVSFYVTGAELKIAAEVIALSVGLKKPQYFLQVSGIKITYDPNGGLFQQVTGLTRPDGSPIDTEDPGACYRIVVSRLIASELHRVGELSAGALEIVPKEADCSTVVTDVDTTIIDADPTADGVQELKQYEALMRYVAQMPDDDGDDIPNIPTSYAQPEGRIVAQ